MRLAEIVSGRPGWGTKSTSWRPATFDVLVVDDNELRLKVSIQRDLALGRIAKRNGVKVAKLAQATVDFVLANVFAPSLI